MLLIRTPLAVITGATSSLAEGAATLDPAKRVELAQTAPLEGAPPAGVLDVAW